METNKAKTDAIMSLFVSGDFCPASVPSDWLFKENNLKTVFADLSEEIRTADISITNLECPLTLSDKKINKIGPNLKASPEMASLLKSSGFNLVTLANNHIYDYGQQGLSDTLDALRKHGLSYVGAGLTLQESKKTFFIEIKHIKLAIVNFAEIEYTCADATRGGANPMDLIDNFYKIQDARNHADHVLVIIHGGHEYYHYPSPEMLRRYRFYAESGASAVIAHHTHCIGGFEQNKGVPIFYSLGNFFFPTRQKMPPLWHEGYALLFKITKDSLAFELLPYEQCKRGTLSIDKSRSKEILKKIKDINLTIENEEQIASHWETFAEEKYQYYLTMISGLGKYERAILRRLGLLKYFNRRKSQLEFVRQAIRCEAHKEATAKVLSKYLK
jgi:hypothetical protein